MKPTRLRLTLIIAMAAISSVQFVIGLLGPFLTVEFALSPAQYGLGTSAFFFVAAATTVFSGAVIARLGSVRTFSSLLLLSGLGLVAAAVSPVW